MTPAIDAARTAGVPIVVHEYDHDPGNREFGLEAASALGIAPERVFKTLLVSLNGQPKSLAVAVVPVSGQLNLKAMAAACKAKKATMADPGVAQRVTGYVVGGISPLGQKRHLPTVLDDSVFAFDTVFVSGGRRGLDIEIGSADLLRMTGAVRAEIGR